MEAVCTSETSVDNHFTWQYNPEDNSEHHTRRRENLKSHKETGCFPTHIKHWLSLKQSFMQIYIVNTHFYVKICFLDNTAATLPYSFYQLFIYFFCLILICIWSQGWIKRQAVVWGAKL
jgi:hypothetical protein